MNILKIASFLILFIACKSQKTIVSKTVSDSTMIQKDSTQTVKNEVAVPNIQASVDAPEEIKVSVDNLDFNYLKAKAKVSYKSPKESQSFTVDIRMKKDSLIWLNISAFGFSVANGLFTKENVKFFDKIHSKYEEYDYATLSGNLDVNVNYDILQAMIVGNQPFKKNKTRVIRENDYFLLKQDEGKVKIDNYVGANKKLKKLLLTDQPTNNKLTLDFEDFNQINNALFPTSSLITLDYTSKTDQKAYQTVINIKHTKVELLNEPLEFPFKVPEKYLQK